MLDTLRVKINDYIQENQDTKQKLFDEISKLDEKLLELNEMLVKINDDDAFLKISPNEAFSILNKLGYTDDSTKMDIYIKLLTNKGDCPDNSNSIYVSAIEDNEPSYKFTLEKRKKIRKVIELLNEYFDYDDCYYYVNYIKLSKFRVFYNMVNLFEKEFSPEEVIPMLKMALCYKNVIGNDKETVYNYIDNANIDIPKIVTEINKIGF